jgi:hypothetical protein
MKSCGRHTRSKGVPTLEPDGADPLPEPVAEALFVDEGDGLTRGVLDIDENVDWTVGTLADVPTVEPTVVVGVPIVPVPMTDVDAPMGGMIGMPIVGVVGVPIVGKVGVPIVGVVGVPMVGNVGVPIVGDSEVPIVVRSGVPIVGESDVPMVGSVGVPIAGLPAPIPGVVGVPMVGVVGVPIVGMVGVPIVGSVEAPVPDVGDRELMPGVMPVWLGGSADELVPRDTDTMDPDPAKPEEELEPGDCAGATHGVAASAVGMTHLTILFIAPPCLVENRSE